MQVVLCKLSYHISAADSVSLFGHVRAFYSSSTRSGDLLRVNCLKAVQNHCSDVASEHAGPSRLSQECAVTELCQLFAYYISAMI